MEMRELGVAKSSSAERTCDRAFTACSVRTGIPVLRTSSAVTRTRRGLGVLRALEDPEAREDEGLGAARGAERVTGREGGRATVRPEPRRSSIVSTRGVLLLFLCLL